MANQVSLMAYLQHGLRHIPAFSGGRSNRNTRNSAYGPEDVEIAGPWAAFNLASIQQQFGAILTAARIADAPMAPSPSPPVNSESSLRTRIDDDVTPRMRRALRCAFAHLESITELNGVTPLTFDNGTLARSVEKFVPDLCIVDPSLLPGTGPNRVPGDVKPSYKWSLEMSNSPDPNTVTEFYQVLSQVNFYMRQNGARYGFVLTDRELVAVRRLDSNGHLELSESIPWTASGTSDQPRLTVLLGLWYLGMLAANDQYWRLG